MSFSSEFDSLALAELSTFSQNATAADVETALARSQTNGKRLSLANFAALISPAAAEPPVANTPPAASAQPVASAPTVASTQSTGNTPPPSQVDGAGNTAPSNTNIPPGNAAQPDASTTH